MLSSFRPSTAPATAGEASRLMCSPSQARASGRSRGRRPGSGGGAARALLARSLAAGHERGVDLLEHDLAIDHALLRSEEHTSELPSLMRTSYAVFCLHKKKKK